MTPQERQAHALRVIAARVVQARQRTDQMGRLPAGEGEDLLCDLEAALMGLVVWRAVPPPPGQQQPPQQRRSLE